MARISRTRRVIPGMLIPKSAIHPSKTVVSLRAGSGEARSKVLSTDRKILLTGLRLDWNPVRSGLGTGQHSEAGNLKREVIVVRRSSALNHFNFPRMAPLDEDRQPIETCELGWYTVYYLRRVVTMSGLTWRPPAAA